MAKVGYEEAYRVYVEGIRDFVKKVNPDTKLRVSMSIPSDVMMINPREEQKGSLPLPVSQVAKPLCDPVLGFRTMSVFVGDDLVFVGGVIPKWGKVGEAWLIVDEKFPELIQPYKKEFFIGFKRHLSLYKYDRIQSDVKAGFDQGIRFAEALGFEKEGLKKRYGVEGADYWGYAYLREIKEIKDK